MEIAIWTTVLTTIITIIQTWAMWYFTQRVKLEDSEMDELVDKLDEEDEPVDAVSRNEVNQALNAVESDVADTLETMLAQIDLMHKSVKGLKTVSDRLIEGMDELHERVDALEDVTQEIPAMVSPSGGSNIHPPEVHEQRRPYVEHPTITPEIPAAAKIKEKRPRMAVGAPDRRVKVKRDKKPIKVHDKDELMREAPVPDPVEEAPLKEVRGEDEPLITDLRAVPFEEHPDAYDNVHELPAFGDGFEAWGASKGRQPRQRGFRRI